MKILIDENLPRYLKKVLVDHDVKTAQEMGWGGTKNGPLLKLAEPLFNVFLTGDKNLRYQQNLVSVLFATALPDHFSANHSTRNQDKFDPSTDHISVTEYF